jgi:hypothetical protein
MAARQPLTRVSPPGCPKVWTWGFAKRGPLGGRESHEVDDREGFSVHDQFGGVADRHPFDQLQGQYTVFQFGF